MSETNRAAYYPDPKKGSNTVQVAFAPYYKPGSNELLVRVRAVAINPVDGAKQTMGARMFPWLEYPLVAGNDIAGEVVQTGSSVTRFSVGDGVVAAALGMDKRGSRPREGGFQEFVIVRDHLTAKIPAGTDYADVCVLPLGMMTAACGLFQHDQLALEKPRLRLNRGETTENNNDSSSRGQTAYINNDSKEEAVLIWGASTSVGNNAVQLAVAAGYTVIATASPKNWGAIRKLGATEVFDYRSKNVQRDIVKAFRGRQSVGALAIGQGSLCE